MHGNTQYQTGKSQNGFWGLAPKDILGLDWPQKSFSGMTGPKCHFQAWLAQKVIFGLVNWWRARKCILGPDNYSTWPENVFSGQTCEISGPKTLFWARPENVFWDWHTFDNLAPRSLGVNNFLF